MTDDQTWKLGMAIYIAIGIPIAYWHRRREGANDRDHSSKQVAIVYYVLALFWPLLLLAIFANRDDKPKSNGPTHK